MTTRYVLKFTWRTILQSPLLAIQDANKKAKQDDEGKLKSLKKHFLPSFLHFFLHLYCLPKYLHNVYHMLHIFLGLYDDLFIRLLDLGDKHSNKGRNDNNE
jgi:hypothetical protein